MKKDGSGRLFIVGIVGIWLFLVGFGYSIQLAYHSIPGAGGSPPVRWPGSSLIALDDARPTLLIFIHPRCPCSSASLIELNRLLVRTGTKVKAYRVDYVPPKRSPGWESVSTDRRTSDSAVRRVLDPGGSEAARFRVETSGHVLLYGTDGRLRFSGGITFGRGHEGPNPGGELLVETILGQSTIAPGCPVFGCPVLTPAKGHAAESDR